ncbi:MAG: hypothetical protein PHX54_05465 [Lentimicrobiaceae bacterium]|nr:hypothetical protein [Lentimicrobiaceae bacterium]
MTPHEKKMKAAAIAVSYFLQENQTETEEISERSPAWGRLGAKMAMSKREFIQRKGKGLWVPK